MLDKLPLQILPQIFQFLELRDLLSVSLANRRLQQSVCRLAFSQIITISSNQNIFPHSSGSLMSDLSVLHMAPSGVPHGGAIITDVEAPASLTLTVRACTDAAAALAKLDDVRLSALHIIVEEESVDLDTELMQLYRLLGACDVRLQRLAAFSVSWHARNASDVQNAVRLMSIVALLQQLDWSVCTSVVLHLHINYLHDDPRLDLIRDLPVELHLHGDRETPDDVLIDNAKLRLLAKSYSYLEGVI